MAELEVNPFSRRFGCDANLDDVAEDVLCALALVRIHAAVDYARRVTPLVQFLSYVVHRIPVFGEYQEFAAAVL